MQTDIDVEETEEAEETEDELAGATAAVSRLMEEQDNGTVERPSSAEVDEADDEADEEETADEENDDTSETDEAADEESDLEYSDQDYQDAAEALGLSDEDLEGLSEKGKRVLGKLAAANAEQRGDAEDQGDTEEQEEDSDEEIPESVTDLLPEVDDKLWDPDVAKMFNGARKAVRVLEERLSSVIEKMEAQEAERDIREFDGFLEAQNAPYKDRFGEGPTRSLDPDSSEFKARRQLANAADALLDSGAAKTSQEAYQMALSAVASDIKDSEAKNRARAAARRAAKQASPSSGGRLEAAKEQYGELGPAVLAVQDKLEEQGG